MPPHRNSRGRRRQPHGNRNTGTALATVRLTRSFGLDQALPNFSINESKTSDHIYSTMSTYQVSAYHTTNNATPTFAIHTINSADIADFTSLGAVFDQFRLDRVEIWMLPRFIPTGPTINMGTMISVIDYDDSNALASTTAALAYENSLPTTGGLCHYRSFTPHLAPALYGGSFTQFGNLRSNAMWVDAASNPNYYGLKTASTITDAAYNWDLIVRVYHSWKNAR
jgi:hypothetical protein